MSMSPARPRPATTRPRSVGLDAHPAGVDGKQRGDKRQRPAAIDRGARPLGRLDLGGDRAACCWSPSPSSLTMVSSASSAEWTGATMMPRAIPKIRNAPATATTQRAPQPGHEEKTSAIAALPRAAAAALRASRRRSEARANHRGPRRGRTIPRPASAATGRDKRRVDEEQRDRHADDRADRGISTGRGSRSAKGMQPSRPAAKARSQPTRAAGNSARLSGAPSASRARPSMAAARLVRPLPLDSAELAICFASLSATTPIFQLPLPKDSQTIGPESLGGCELTRLSRQGGEAPVVDCALPGPLPA